MELGNFKIRRLFFAKHSEAGVVDVCVLRQNGKTGPVIKFYRFTDRKEEKIVYLQALDFAKRAHKLKFSQRQYCERCQDLISKSK